MLRIFFFYYPDVIIETASFGDMFKSVYDTNNNGIVDKAEKINGVDQAGNLYYYGKDTNGNIGFFLIPIQEVDLSNYWTKGQSYNKTEVEALIDDIVIPDVAFPALESNTTIAVGGLIVNSVIANKTVLEVLRLMLKPFIPPNATVTFSSLTLSSGSFLKSGTLFEQGASVTAMSFNYSYNANGDTFNSAVASNPNLAAPITITTMGTVTCNFITPITTNSNRVISVVTDWSISDDENDSITLTPIPPIYYGSGTVGQNVTTLTKNGTLNTSKSRTNLPFDGIAGPRYIYAYPKSYGLLTSIVDNNNFNIIADFGGTNGAVDQTVTFADGTSVVYSVYTIQADRIAGNITLTFN
jgi:hypothetical protein